MKFLKNHYEKIILSLVLMGLIGGVVVLFIQVGQVKSQLRKTEEDLGKPGSNPVDVRPRDPYVEVLQKSTNPPSINLSTGHRLLNPFRWAVNSAGDLIKVDREDKLGPGALQVVQVTNLHFVVTLEKVSGIGDNPSYQISTYRQGLDRNKKNAFIRLEDKTRAFPYGDGDATLLLKEVRGEPASPTELVFDLERPESAGGTIEVIVKPDEPYSELLNREADLLYPPENRTFKKVKVEDSLSLGSESYKVIAITDKQVIFEAQNKKRTIIDYGSLVP